MGEAAAGDWFWWVLALVLAGGIAPGSYFLATWWPARWAKAIALDLRLSVVSVLSFYVLAAVRAVVDAQAPSVVVAVVYLGIFAAVDVWLWLRAVTWDRYRRRWQADDRRSGEDRRTTVDLTTPPTS